MNKIVIAGMMFVVLAQGVQVVASERAKSDEELLRIAAQKKQLTEELDRGKGTCRRMYEAHEELAQLSREEMGRDERHRLERENEQLRGKYAESCDKLAALVVSRRRDRSDASTQTDHDDLTEEILRIAIVFGIDKQILDEREEQRQIAAFKDRIRKEDLVAKNKSK